MVSECSIHRTLIKAPKESGSTSMATSLAVVAGLAMFKNRAVLKPGEKIHLNHLMVRTTKILPFCTWIATEPGTVSGMTTMLHIQLRLSVKNLQRVCPEVRLKRVLNCGWTPSL